MSIPGPYKYVSGFPTHGLSTVYLKTLSLDCIREQFESGSVFKDADVAKAQQSRVIQSALRILERSFAYSRDLDVLSELEEMRGPTTLEKDDDDSSDTRESSDADIRMYTCQVLWAAATQEIKRLRRTNSSNRALISELDRAQATKSHPLTVLIKVTRDSGLGDATCNYVIKYLT